MPPQMPIPSGRLPQSEVKSGRVSSTSGRMSPGGAPLQGAGAVVDTGLMAGGGTTDSRFLKTLFQHPIGLGQTIASTIAQKTPEVRRNRQSIEEARKNISNALNNSNLSSEQKHMLANVYNDLPVWGDVFEEKSAKQIMGEVLGTALWVTPYKMIKPLSGLTRGGQMINTMTRSAMIGGGFATASAMSDDEDVGSILKSAALGAGVGAGIGLAVGGVGAGVGLAKSAIPTSSKEAIISAISKRTPSFILPLGRVFEKQFGAAGKSVGDAFLWADRQTQALTAKMFAKTYQSGLYNLKQNQAYKLGLALEGKARVTPDIKTAYNTIRNADSALAKLAKDAGVRVKVNTTVQDTNFVQNTIKNHLTQSKNLIKNTSADKINALGGNQGLIDRTRENIVTQLKSKGLGRLSTAVENIDITKVKNNIPAAQALKNFEKEVGQLFKITKGKITEVPFASMKNHFTHQVPSLEYLQNPEKKKLVIQSAIDRGYFKTQAEASKTLESWMEFSRVEGIGRGTGKAYREWLVRSGQASNITEARGMAIRHLKQSRLPRFGPLEHAREIDFPFFNPNPQEVIPFYHAGAAKRINELKYFGGYDKKLFSSAIGKIERAQGMESAKEFRHFLNVATGVVEKSSGNEKFQAIIRAMNTPKLSFAQVLNTAQSVNTLLHTDAPSTLKALKLAFTNEGYIKALKAGALNESIFRETQAAIGAGRAGRAQEMGSKFLKYTGFTFTERFNRTVAANAGMNYANKTFNKLMKDPTNRMLRSRLVEYGINPDAALKLGKLTPDQILMSGQITSELTQFRNRAIDLPAFYQSPTGKTLFQFKTFSYNQSRLLVNEFAREASVGNYTRIARDLIVLGTIFPMTGEVIGNVRSVMSGSTRSTKPLRRYLENLMMVGGLGLWGDFIDSARWGRLWEFAGGPSISTGVGATERFIQVTTGSRKPSTQDAKFIFRQFPFGVTVANYMFPADSRDRETFLETMEQWVDEL